MEDGFVAQSGDFLDIQITQEHGTVITLTIAMAAIATEPPDSAEPQQQEKIRPVEGRGLLVEDEELVRLVIARILHRLGI